jgi:hypothetical protein
MKGPKLKTEGSGSEPSVLKNRMNLKLFKHSLSVVLLTGKPMLHGL